MSIRASRRMPQIAIVMFLTVTLYVLPLKANGQTLNGISVGRPKVFDNRTLTLMLESLSESLRSVQFVDQKSLAAAFSLLQGFRSSEVTSNLTVSPIPIPGLKQETITNTGNVSTAGTPLPDTTKQTNTADRAAFTPQPPTLDTLPAFQGFNPTYGENPSDLLSDQVNLTYQIFNLRMLLERSLSDRLLGDQPRRQAVLGFNVTIDPPRTAEDAVAVVEIKLEVEGSSRRDGLSLVSLMPQEKTYNSAALSTKSRAFGGAAVAKMIQVGYSERRRGQVFYLYRDTDTVSYERMNPDNPNQIVFGWMFRPVLGRRSISPGLRQLFAIVALPSDDQLTDENDGKAQLPDYLKARVRTYWKKYDHETMTSFEERDANRATRFRYGFSLNLSKPEIFSKRYEEAALYEKIAVRSTSNYQGALGPQLKRISWRSVGAKSVLISAEGNNFFSETKVTLGDKSYASPADGLILKSSQAFDLTTSLDALANGPGAIIGRYGPGVPLTLPEPNPNVPPGGIRIHHLKLDPAAAGNRFLEIHLSNLGGPGPQLAVNNLPQDPKWGTEIPIVTFNGNVVPLPYKFIDEVDVNRNVVGVILQCNVPESFVSNDGGLVKILYPFLSQKWTATTVIYNPALNFQITRLSSKSIFIYTRDLLGFTIDPSNLNPKTPPTHYCWQLLAGDSSPIKLKTDTCLDGAPGTAGLSSNAVSVKLTLDIPDKIVLVAPDKSVFALDVPKIGPPDAAATKPIMLNQNDSVWIDIAVKDASNVDNVEANHQKLVWRPLPKKEGEAVKSPKTNEPVKTIQVQVTQDLTAKPSDVDITVVTKDSKTSTVRLHISCTTNCNNKGGKQ